MREAGPVRRWPLALRLGRARHQLSAVLRIPPPPYRRLAIAGWLLFAVSWLTPSIDARQLGTSVFFHALRLARGLAGTQGPGGALLGLCVIFGWLANFSVFIRWPVWARAVWIAAPWVAFAVVLTHVPVRPTLPQRAAYFLYFYPWAAGIALIHWANIAAARGTPVPVTGSLR